MLIVGGVAILLIERAVKRPSVDTVEAMPTRTALGIGIIQCLSMIPGVSRSGATIMGALALGVERKTAAEFSLFLAVPTMLAAWEIGRAHVCTPFTNAPLVCRLPLEKKKQTMTQKLLNTNNYLNTNIANT